MAARGSSLRGVLLLLIPFAFGFGFLFAHLRARRIAADEAHFDGRRRCIEWLRLAQRGEEDERIRLCRNILATWQQLDGSELDLAALDVALPLPLRWTGTVTVSNPASLRAETGRQLESALETISGEVFRERAAWEAWLAQHP